MDQKEKDMKWARRLYNAVQEAEYEANRGKDDGLEYGEVLLPLLQKFRESGMKETKLELMSFTKSSPRIDVDGKTQYIAYGKYKFRDCLDLKVRFGSGNKQPEKKDAPEISVLIGRSD